jgi:dUTP pyrophosphatase
VNEDGPDRAPEHRPGASVAVSVARLPHGEGIPLPHPATLGSAGADLRAAVVEPVIIGPGDRALVPTGFCIAVPFGYEAQVRPRSGLALRHGVTVPNTPGTIDSDYRGELSVILLNAGREPFTVARGDRIAQLVIAPVVSARFDEVANLDETERGGGGFGHTGKR